MARCVLLLFIIGYDVTGCASDAIAAHQMLKRNAAGRRALRPRHVS
jgi:hypothetical protein